MSNSFEMESYTIHVHDTLSPSLQRNQQMSTQFPSLICSVEVAAILRLKELKYQINNFGL